MKTVSLRPTRHIAPKCLDWNDEQATRTFEVEMRVHRAYTESYRITALPGTAEVAYLVRGESDRAYEVDVVDQSGEHDTCSCPDFLGGQLGTCKHLEAVRRLLLSRSSRGVVRRLKPNANAPVLGVAARGQARLIALGAWRPRHFEALGLEPRARGVIECRADVSLTPGQNGEVRVTHAAATLARALAQRDALARRRRALSRGFRGGLLKTDVLRVSLFPYQRDGVVHLACAGRALLADDMGLGKTVQAIAACELLRARGEVSRVLVVTTASLKEQWAREIERCSGERSVVVSGSAEARRAALGSDAPYKVLNYELTWRELGMLRALDADVVIYDEAQRAKNFRTKTAITLRSIPSRFVFVLTGTPIENRLDDLYALLQLLDPDILGPLWRFNVEHHTRNDKGRILGYTELGRLRERIAPAVLRRRKQDVLTQLPALTEQTRYTPFSEEQAEVEAGYRRDAARYARIAERRALLPDELKQMMALLLKARQACNALELCRAERHASPKLDEFEALVSEIAAQGSSKILVFSEWVEMLKLAAERLDAQGIGHVMLHGGIPVEKRPALLERFREQSELSVLLSTDAGGVGLNLQVASYVIHLDLPWNPARLDQRTARAHRLGQTRGVSVTYLCAESGIERGIEGTLAVKRELRSAALDPESAIEDLEAPSFAVFMRQLRGVLDRAGELENGASDADPTRTLEADRDAEAHDAVAAGVTAGVMDSEPDRDVEAAQAGSGLGEPAAQVPRTAQSIAADRLRFARVVLDAGFPTDAVHAAYEALASAIRGLAELPPDAPHASLVAAIYRDLGPSGRVSQAAHGVLARLHDLTTLGADAGAIDASLAAHSVTEAEHWVERMDAGPVVAAEPEVAAPN